MVSIAGRRTAGRRNDGAPAYRGIRQVREMRRRGGTQISDGANFEAAARDPLPLSLAAATEADRTVVRALVITASSAVSLVLHGSVLAAMLLLNEPKPGGNSLPTEAISVEIVPSDVLDAAGTSPSPEASASASSVQSDPGAVEDVAVASPVQPETVEPLEEPSPTEPRTAEAPDAPSRSNDIPTDAPDEAPAELALEKAAATAEPEETSPPAAAPPRPIEKTERATPPRSHKTHKTPSRKGGAPSRAARESAPSRARVSASSGAVINYAAAVRARVASRKPSGPGKRGTVVVTFGVSRSGGLAFASISRSSGDAGLDRTVLSAVRSAAPFPTPPQGASPGQLRFSMPFYFH
jgi:protein TonB